MFSNSLPDRDDRVAVIASTLDNFTGYLGGFEGDVIALAEGAEVKQGLFPAIFTGIDARTIIDGRCRIDVHRCGVCATMDVAVSIAAATGAFFKFAFGS